MITASEILTQVHRRSAQLARHTQRAEVAATSSQNDLLIDFLRMAVNRILVESLRLEGSLLIDLQAGIPDYRISQEDIFSVDAVSYGSKRLLLSSDSTQMRLSAAELPEGYPTSYTVYAGYLWLDRKPSADFVSDYPQLQVDGRIAVGYPVGEADDIIALLPPSFEEALVRAVLSEWLFFTLDPAVQPLAERDAAYFEGFLLKYRGQNQAPKTAKITYRPI